MRIILLLFLFNSFHSEAQFSERSNGKNDFGIRLGLPQVNALFLYNQSSPNNRIGFNGLSGGIYYFYKKNNFIEFTTSFCATSRIPVPGPVTYLGKYEIANAFTFTASNNHSSDFFNLGYGLSVNHYSFSDAFKSSDTLSESYAIQTKSVNLGVHLTGQLLIGKRFALALNYSPTFIRFSSSSALAYQHHLGLEFLWRLKLKRK